MKRKKYDSLVVMLYLLGKEELLPKDFRKRIPVSTICRWRKVDYSTYLGMNFDSFLKSMLHIDGYFFIGGHSTAIHRNEVNFKRGKSFSFNPGNF